MSRLPDKTTAGLEALRVTQDTQDRVQILGYVLFTLVMWARNLKIDPESALREANMRFAENFRQLERDKQAGKLDKLDDDDIFRLWK